MCSCLRTWILCSGFVNSRLNVRGRRDGKQGGRIHIATPLGMQNHLQPWSACQHTDQCATLQALQVRRRCLCKHNHSNIAVAWRVLQHTLKRRCCPAAARVCKAACLLPDSNLQASRRCSMHIKQTNTKARTRQPPATCTGYFSSTENASTSEYGCWYCVWIICTPQM